MVNAKELVQKVSAYKENASAEAKRCAAEWVNSLESQMIQAAEHGCNRISVKKPLGVEALLVYDYAATLGITAEKSCFTKGYIVFSW